MPGTEPTTETAPEANEEHGRNQEKEKNVVENYGEVEQDGDEPIDAENSSDQEPAATDGNDPTSVTKEEMPTPLEEGDDEAKDEEKKTVREETETVATTDSVDRDDKQPSEEDAAAAAKKARSAFKYDPNKITLRFLFANRDGLAVNVECNPTDTVGEVKGALISVWPEGKNIRRSNLTCPIWSCIAHSTFRSIDFPKCDGGDNLRLICMGKGYLMPDTRTLEDCQVPVFKTHATPINVSVRPKNVSGSESKGKKHQDRDTSSSSNRHSSNTASVANPPAGGCCVVM